MKPFLILTYESLEIRVRHHICKRHILQVLMRITDAGSVFRPMMNP